MPLVPIKGGPLPKSNKKPAKPKKSQKTQGKIKSPEIKNWIAPEGLDEECLEICQAMNSLPGIITVESCCGHGTDPYRIFFRLDDETPDGLFDGLLDGLPALLYWMRHFKDDC